MLYRHASDGSTLATVASLMKFRSLVARRSELLSLAPKVSVFSSSAPFRLHLQLLLVRLSDSLAVANLHMSR